MSNPAQKRKVAVSYAWKQEREGENHGAVVQFCEGLTNCNIEVLRDTEHLKFGQGISDFMGKVGSSDLLCIFLSDDYLRSPNCMHELLVAWQRSRHNVEEFRSRVKVWLMPGVSAIHDMDIRGSWMDYWHREFKKREPLLDQIRDGVSTMTVDQILRIKAIATNVEAILAFFADTLHPDSLEKFEEWAKSEFPGLEGPSEDVLARLYSNTAIQVNRVLGRNETVGQFLLDNSDGLVDSDTGRRKLHSDLTGPTFRVLRHLNAIRTSFDAMRFNRRADLDDLEFVIGGVVVMAIDRKWVFEQRAKLSSTAHQYPGRTATVKLGGDMLAVDFIHLVTQAIADGPARLQRMFSVEARDVNLNALPGVVREVPDYTEGKTSVPDLPGEHGGISELETVKSIKKHFIRHILDVNTGNDDGIIDSYFEDVKARLMDAFINDRLPYFSSGVSFRQLSGLIKNKLELRHLILIFPSGKEREEAVLQDSFQVLCAVCRIFQAIDARRKQLP